MYKQSFITLLLLVFLLLACQNQVEESTESDPSVETPEVLESENGNADEQALLHKKDPAGRYGAGAIMPKTTALADILAKPADYEGRILQVKGTVEQVCPKRGCWIDVKDQEATNSIRVKVTDGQIVFPLSAEGRPITAEGVLEKIELDLEQTREWLAHEAEELGRDFDAASVQEAMTIWRIAGMGAVIE